MLSGFFYVLWFIIMAFVYISTLGGVRWQPYLHDANFDEKYEYDLKPGKVGRNIFAGLVFAGMLFIVLASLLGISGAGDIKIFADLGYISLYIVPVLWFIVNPLLFRKKVRQQNEETIEREY